MPGWRYGRLATPAAPSAPRRPRPRRAAGRTRRWRQAGGRPRRSGAHGEIRGSVGSAPGGVGCSEPVHRGVGEDSSHWRTSRELVSAGAVGDRIDQHLEGGRGRRRRGPAAQRPAARLPPAESPATPAARIDAEPAAWSAAHRWRRSASSGGAGRVLGREPVADRDHRHAGRVASRRQRPSWDVEVADHPAAAVEEDEQRCRRAGRGKRRDVEARGDRPVRPGDRRCPRTSAIADRPSAGADPRLVADWARASVDAATGEEAVAAGPARQRQQRLGLGERASGRRSSAACRRAGGSPRRQAAGPFEDAVLDRHRQSRQLCHRRAGYST